MGIKFVALSAIVLASQLFSVYGSIPAIQSLKNFVSGAPNALTVCNNYTTTCTPVSQMDGKYYTYMKTPSPREPGLKCETITMETIVPDKIVISTRHAMTDDGTVTNYFTHVSSKPGQLRTARLPTLLDFSTVNYIYYNCTVGMVVISCLWNDNTPLKFIVYISTTEPNPPAEKVQILLNKAKEQGIDTSALVHIDHNDCPCEPKEPLVTKVVNLAFLTSSVLLFQQVLPKDL